MEKKTFKFELKELKEDGQFEGYASVFDVKDAVNDVVEPGAFKKTLTEKREFPLLWYHDPRDVLGIVEAEEDSKGLKIIGKLNMGVQKAREKYELLKQKAIKGLSIGYDTIKEVWDKETRKLKEIKLWEVSLCTFQANPEATVTAVKKENIEQKAGKVISSANSKLIKQAINALTALLEAAEPQKSTQKSDEKPQDGDDKPEDRLLSETIEELKKLKNLMEVKKHGKEN